MSANNISLKIIHYPFQGCGSVLFFADRDPAVFLNADPDVDLDPKIQYIVYMEDKLEFVVQF